MPPKIEKKLQSPQPPHPNAIRNAKKEIEDINGKGKVNNSIFRRSLEGLTQHAKKEKIITSYRKTQKLVANEKAAEMAAELKRTGGIYVRKDIYELMKEWPDEYDYPLKPGTKFIQGAKLKPIHTKLVKDINNIFAKYKVPGSNGSFNPEPIRMIFTRGDYGLKAFAAEILSGKYDDRLSQLEYALYNPNKDIISIDPEHEKIEKEVFLGPDQQGYIKRIINKRREILAPGGGAGSEGGARRRRTHKRKTHRRKTHKRRH